jgi:hypothetical protein
VYSSHARLARKQLCVVCSVAQLPSGLMHMNHTSELSQLPTVSASLLTLWLKRYESELTSKFGADVLLQIENRPHEFLTQFGEQLPASLNADIVLIEYLTTERCRVHMWHACRQLGVKLADSTSTADLVVHCLIANWAGLDWLRATRDSQEMRTYQHFFVQCRPELLQHVMPHAPYAPYRSALDAEISHLGRGRVLSVYSVTIPLGFRIVIQRVADQQRMIKVDPKTWQRSLVQLHEEYNDELIYVYERGELRVSARDARDAEVYRRLATPFLFQWSGLSFEVTPPGVFTLQPILDRGSRLLDCHGLAALKSIRVAKLSYEDAFDRNSLHHLESDGDVLADFERRDWEFPKHARILSATFRVTMKSKSEFWYRVKIPNLSECDCSYGDYAMSRWLIARGILLPRNAKQAEVTKGIWQALEFGPSALRTLEEWKATGGKGVEAITQMIRRTPLSVTSVPSCHANAPRMRVASEGDMRIAICDRGISPERVLSPSECDLYSLDIDRLKEEIMSALGLKQTTRKSDAIDDRLNIGNWCPAVGVYIPAVLVWGPDRIRFEIAVRRVVQDIRPRVLILTPTAELWPDELREWVQANGGYLLPLCEVVEVRDKKLVGSQLWPELERRIRSSFGIDEVRVAKPKPRPKRRGDLLAKKERIQKVLDSVKMERMREIDQLQARGGKPPWSLTSVTQQQIAKLAACTASSVSRILNNENEGKLGKLLKELNDSYAMDQEYRKLKGGGVTRRLAL